MEMSEAAVIMRTAMQACADGGWEFFCHWSESFWMQRGEDSILIQSDYDAPRGLLHPGIDEG